MIFEDRKLALITKLRKELLSTVLTKFPEFAEQTPLPHSTKDDKISDIIILGHALARPEGSNDLQNIFIKETVPLSAGVSHLEALKDPDTLVAVVTQMKFELDAAKSDIETIKTENETLLIKNEELKSRLVICEAKLGIVDKSKETSVGKSEVSSSDSAEDTGDDSDTEVLQARKQKKIMKTKNSKKSLHEVQIVPLEAVSEPTFAFIGNAKLTCSRESIHEHITKNINLKIKLSDIQELPITCKMRAFKVAIPRKDLQQLISSDWPIGIKVEPHDISSHNMSAHKVPLSQLPKGKKKFNKQWKFRKQHQAFHRHQNGYQPEDFRNYFH